MFGLFVLGLLDLLAGIGLALNVRHDLFFFLAVVMLLKGIWSVLAGIAAEFYFDVAGIADVAAGIFLLLVSAGLFLDWFAYIGFLVIIKGLYSLGISLVTK